MANGKIDLKQVFGENVFNDEVMRERLPKNVYKALRRTMDEGVPLDPSVADVVANAMKDWAIEKGATHYTHWFQPMTGITAEKHESFLNTISEGRAITEFSGKSLIKGEPDASSFPSGGIRATFEARGYTVWDATSYAFLKEDEGGLTLCIPTAFCAYTGEALDKKTPLLRSMEAVSKQALRILRLFGNTTAKRVFSTVGAEQEYFLIDKDLYLKRKDLVFTGRTLFGAKPPKGQELEDHYFGSLKDRVANFMKDLDYELWKMGIPVKTKHNEVAPAQHEIAPIFENANIATDHNQVIMDTLKRVANRHNLACLLHEKPFAGVNGSGKHNNWSLSTNEGQNLFEPGKTPHENAQFLIFLSAVIKAVDEYAELLRASAANTGNDHRLGANEAPPAIISMFLGDQLTGILENIEKGNGTEKREREYLRIGVSTLPPLPKDATDRNRTSPFAFTGNKFEFRMVPSSSSIANPNVVLNTAVAEVLSEIADRLEGAKDFDSEVNEVVKEIVKNHKRIIFNGDGYSEDWIIEAERRGLKNIKNTVDAITAWISEKSINLFTKHGVFTEVELRARYEIKLEEYIKHINIEARTMIDMVKKQIIPVVLGEVTNIANSINAVKMAIPDLDVTTQAELLKELQSNLNLLKKETSELEAELEEAHSFNGDIFEKACIFRDRVAEKMKNVRVYGDKLETLIDENKWPFPSYEKLLFYV
ncbi:MAG: glutamine synthetase catalytic region [Caloramator sp.]|jgi:glutamine synthetase|uniref:glutamine synthetase III family protein n=1 Tax=Caloramator sp. TaxID=1871330 RepID=UPI001DACDABF|nr:glutamine synthetase III [Caloramator sp.]MBZ4663771.1 glutamine synthetase catalytic region [Caloramator sp.]